MYCFFICGTPLSNIAIWLFFICGTVVKHCWLFFNEASKNALSANHVSRDFIFPLEHISFYLYISFGKSHRKNSSSMLKIWTCSTHFALQWILLWTRICIASTQFVYQTLTSLHQCRLFHYDDVRYRDAFPVPDPSPTECENSKTPHVPPHIAFEIFAPPAGLNHLIIS